jgi:ribonuclease HI
MMLKAGTDAAMEWEGEEGDVWVAFTAVARRDGGYFLNTRRMDGRAGRWQMMELGVIQLAMDELEVTEKLVGRRISETELGVAGRRGGTEMHWAIRDFWRTSGRARPDGIRERMRKEEDEHGKEFKRGRVRQSTLTGTPMSAPGESMVPGEGGEVITEAAVRCTLVKGQEIERHAGRAGQWELGRGRAVWRPREGEPIQVEMAKVLVWKWRERLDWDGLALQVARDSGSAEEAEQRGFRMPAWQLLSQIRRQSGATHLVGAPKAMADIHFSTWTAAYDLSGATSLEDSVILLSAITPDLQMEVVGRLQRGGSWVVIAGVYGLAPGIQETMEELVTSQVVLPMERQGERVVRHPKVYVKGWWKTGTKRLCLENGEMRVWWGEGGEMDLVPIADSPIVEGAFGGGALSRQVRHYLDVTQSGPYLKAGGLLIWTDGARRQGEDGGCVGAGIFSAAEPTLTTSFAVGGEAYPVRGEMAAITRAVQMANGLEAERGQGIDITVLTDSMTTMQILERWTRQDFGPHEDGEMHWDILRDLLAAIRAREGMMTVVWVKAHTGDVGNELADIRAGEGCWAREKRWDKPIFPIELYGIESRRVLSAHGWNKAVDREASEWLGRHARARLQGKPMALSTESLVREDRGREFLGYSLVEGSKHGLTEHDTRGMLQARSHCYPTEAYLARNNGKDPATGVCRLCRRQTETYGHVQAGCRELQDDHRTAHNMVAEAILGGIKEGAKGLVVKAETELGEWFPDCPWDLRRFRPDAFIVDDKNRRVVVWEFTRGMAERDADFRAREGLKINAYHGVRLFLRGRLPAYQVVQQTVVMGILGSMRQKEFERQLEELGLGDRARTETAKRAAIALVRANGYVLGKRLEKLQRLGYG